MAQDEVILDGDLNLDVPLDGDGQLDLQLDGAPGLLTMIEAGIAQIIFNDDYTITFIMTDGREFTTGSIRGEIGPQGTAGPQGVQGIQGPTGPRGETGQAGPKGDTGNTGPAGPQGPKGDTGASGKDGIDGKDGINGKDGADGKDGISPTVSITAITGGHRITITDANGQHSADVMDGDDYTLTQQDKADIAGLVNIPVDDVQVNGGSVVSNGVAVIPMASSDDYGVVKINNYQGIRISGGALATYPAASSHAKAGSNEARPLVPKIQHESVFYGLAKAAGDTTQSASSNAVGTYTNAAKTAIRTMLGIDTASLVAEIRNALNL